MVVAQIDQGGLSLPNRDYYLKTDDKSKELLAKYRAHIQKMLVLAGESEAQATADAGTVIELETALAQAQMDNVKRRDPKNINNKMTLAQVRELTPSIDWDAYLKAVKAPASEHYIVTSPDFFRAEEKLLNRASARALAGLHALAGDSPRRPIPEQGRSWMRTSTSSRIPSPEPKSSNRAGAAASAQPTAISAKPSARPMSTAPSRPKARPAPSRWCTPSKPH